MVLVSSLISAVLRGDCIEALIRSADGANARVYRVYLDCGAADMRKAFDGLKETGVGSSAAKAGDRADDVAASDAMGRDRYAGTV